MGYDVVTSLLIQLAFPLLKLHDVTSTSHTNTATPHTRSARTGTRTGINSHGTCTLGCLATFKVSPGIGITVYCCLAGSVDSAGAGTIMFERGGSAGQSGRRE